MSILPVWLRRELGMKVNGPKPGFKHAKKVKAVVKDTVPIWSATHVPLDLQGSVEDVEMLPVHSGVLVRDWRARYRTVNCAQASIRNLHPKATFSIRTVLDKGAKKDLLIIRVA